MKLRTLLQTLTFVTASGLAMAGSGTIAVLDGGGVSRTFDVVTDGSGNFIAKNVICDQSAAANCAGVDAGKSLQVAGEGTAGSAAGGVVTVQGVASMTPVGISAASGSIASGAIAAGALASGSGVDGWNLTEGAKGDAAYTSGSGSIVAVLKGIYTNTGAAVPAGSNNIGSIDILGHAGGTLDGTAGSPATGVLTVQGASSMTPVLVTPSAPADPCYASAKTNVPISTASGTVALVAGVSAKKIYVCSLTLIVSGAIAVSLSEGSGTTCGTSAQAGVIGVATNGTAANGLSFAANGGLTLGSGTGTVAQTATAANYLCLFQSGTTQIAGNLTYVQQ